MGDFNFKTMTRDINPTLCWTRSGVKHRLMLASVAYYKQTKSNDLKQVHLTLNSGKELLFKDPKGLIFVQLDKHFNPSTD